MKDSDVKELLQQIVKEAKKDSVSPRRRLSVRHVGLSHDPDYPCKTGWYVFIQNFKNLSIAKRSEDNLVRFNFRIVTFKSDLKKEPTFQVLVWHPKMGNQINAEIIFQEPVKTGEDKFIQFMTTAINLTVDQQC